MTIGQFLLNRKSDVAFHARLQAQRDQFVTSLLTAYAAEFAAHGNLSPAAIAALRSGDQAAISDLIMSEDGITYSALVAATYNAWAFSPYSPS